MLRHNEITAWLLLFLAGTTFTNLGCGLFPSDSDDDATTQGGEATPTPRPLEPGGPETPVLMISDGGNYRIVFVRTDTRALFYEVDISRTFAECNFDPIYCAVTEIAHSVHNGADYLDMNLSFTDGVTLNPAAVRRIRLSDPPEPVFSLEHFDFSGLPYGQEICDYDPADPCGTGTSPGCRIYFPHDFDVLMDDSDAGYAELLVTDLATQRVLKVNFDYGDGSTCGRVEWVLDSHTEGFDPTFLPNDADYFEQDGEQYLLTGYYSTEELLGASKLQLWKRSSEEDTWAVAWTYPKPGDSAQPFLNTPHAPMLFTDAGGNLMLRYGHSRGDSDEWGVGYKGSIGVARLDRLEDPPVYVEDEKFPDGDLLTPTGFVRDIEPLPDGRFLVADSGCVIFGTCPLDGRVYLISPESEVSSDDLSGAWREDRGEQRFVDLDMEKVDSYVCGFSTVYEADYMMLADLGEDLSKHTDDTIATCPR